MWLSYSWQYNDNSYFNFDPPPSLSHTQPFITLNLLTWHKELFVSLELSNEHFNMTAGSLFD